MGLKWRVLIVLADVLQEWQTKGMRDHAWNGRERGGISSDQPRET
jgi:hypothetical protein